jgi:hypothetical protein
MAFLSAHPSSGSASDRPQTIEGIIELAGKNPHALRWPIVVNWNDGQVAIGNVDGVRDILETIRKRRDGELKEEEVEQPKGWFT